MSRDVNTSFAQVLVDEWVRGGVTHAVVAPGSRSAPIALALAADERITVHVILDERSAAFVAVGIGRATGGPAVVLTTSGTAAANLHPAILEAHHGWVPLIACTADRPPELRDTGAPQTINQVRLFGDAVRWWVDAEVPTDRAGAGPAWRALGARSVTETVGSPPGPVHLNLPLREPLVPTGEPLVDGPGRAGGGPWTAVPKPPQRQPDPSQIEALATQVVAEPHGLLLGGWGANVRAETAQRFSLASGWPIIADPLANLSGEDCCVTAYEALARTEAFTRGHVPRAAWRVGAPLTSTTFARWLDREEADITVVDPSNGWRDPSHAAAAMVSADADALLLAVAERVEALASGRDQSWADDWRAGDGRARAAIDATLDGWSECSEPRIARDLTQCLPDDATLVVASSMPVRDVEWFGRSGPRRVISNRGVNGIDGFVSTALGVALGTEGPVVALTGDLSFLHDGGGLLAARGTGADVVFVVVDNRGGGIFSFLPQADHPEHFESLFGTPPTVDLGVLATAHGFSVRWVDAPLDLAAVLNGAIAEPGPAVVIVRTERARNVEHHREVWRAVAAAFSEW